jgi:hypothetical protein
MEKHRNLDYLEHELEKYHAAEEERRREQDDKVSRIRKGLMDEEREILRGNREVEADEYAGTRDSARERQAQATADYGSRKSTTAAAVQRAQMAAQASKSRATGSLSARASDESSEEDTDRSASGSGELSDEDEVSVGQGARRVGSDDLMEDDGEDSGSDERF